MASALMVEPGSGSEGSYRDQSEYDCQTAARPGAINYSRSAEERPISWAH
jgi:hypothetical protein